MAMKLLFLLPLTLATAAEISDTQEDRELPGWAPSAPASPYSYGGKKGPYPSPSSPYSGGKKGPYPGPYGGKKGSWYGKGGYGKGGKGKGYGGGVCSNICGPMWLDYDKYTNDIVHMGGGDGEKITCGDLAFALSNDMYLCDEHYDKAVDRCCRDDWPDDDDWMRNDDGFWYTGKGKGGYGPGKGKGLGPGKGGYYPGPYWGGGKKGPYPSPYGGKKGPYPSPSSPYSGGKKGPYPSPYSGGKKGDWYGKGGKGKGYGGGMCSNICGPLWLNYDKMTNDLVDISDSDKITCGELVDVLYADDYLCTEYYDKAVDRCCMDYPDDDDWMGKGGYYGKGKGYGPGKGKGGFYPGPYYGGGKKGPYPSPSSPYSGGKKGPYPSPYGGGKKGYWKGKGGYEYVYEMDYINDGY